MPVAKKVNPRSGGAAISARKIWVVSDPSYHIFLGEIAATDSGKKPVPIELIKEAFETCIAT